MPGAGAGLGSLPQAACRPPFRLRRPARPAGNRLAGETGLAADAACQAGPDAAV